MSDEHINEETRENKNEVEDEISDEAKALTSQTQKENKHIEAKNLVEEAKSIAKASDSELEDCKLLLEEDLREYEEAKHALKTVSLNDTKILLSEFDDIQISDVDEDVIIVFEPKEDIKPLALKEVNSGKFTGFVLSLLMGATTFIGLIYLATEKLGMTLDIANVPSKETMTNIASWFGTLVGVENNVYLGASLLLFITLLVMIIVYYVRVGSKAKSNLHFAHKQLKDTQIYITHKANCKMEMERVDAHIADAIKTLKDYEVLLYEQNGKLKRILYFEGGEKNIVNLTTTSIDIVKDTENLLEHIQRFITTPMSEEGKLSGKSTLFLHSAKENIQKLLNKWN